MDGYRFDDFIEKRWVNFFASLFLAYQYSPSPTNVHWFPFAGLYNGLVEHFNRVVCKGFFPQVSCIATIVDLQVCVRSLFFWSLLLMLWAFRDNMESFFPWDAFFGSKYLESIRFIGLPLLISSSEELPSSVKSISWPQLMPENSVMELGTALVPLTLA